MTMEEKPSKQNVNVSISKSELFSLSLIQMIQYVTAIKQLSKSLDKIILDHAKESLDELIEKSKKWRLKLSSEEKEIKQDSLI